MNPSTRGSHVCPTELFFFLAILLGVIASSFLGGCPIGPHYHAPAPPTVATYTPDPQPPSTVGTTGAAGTAQHLATGSDIPSQWWTLFRSPALDRLVRDALANSPTLAQATARLKKAQEKYNASN